MRSKERSEWMKSAIRLKQQEEIIEKTLDDFVISMKLEPEILKALQNEKYAYATERRKFSNSLRASVLEIAKDLRAIESIIANSRTNSKIDVDGFRTKLTTLGNKIRVFNKDCPLEKLIVERTELEQYLREFSTSLIKYDNRNNLTGRSLDSRRSSKIPDSAPCQDYKEIRNFDSLVAKTGHTQNWTDEDHIFFLKARKTCPNVTSMIAVVRKKCPDLSVERIVNHENWYKIYVELREAQRKTIEEWRSKKKLEKTGKNDDIESCGIVDDKSIAEIIDEESVRNDDASKRKGKFARSEDSSTSEKKEMINRWRIERNNARSVEHERAKSESELRKIEDEERRLARARRIKATLSAWREKKDENLETRSATNVAESNRTIAKSDGDKLFKLFRLQDEEFLKKRKSLLATRSKSNSGIFVRQKTRPSSDVTSTLLKPTKVWIEKCKRPETSSGLSEQFLYVKDIPKLATRKLRNLESS